MRDVGRLWQTKIIRHKRTIGASIQRTHGGTKDEARALVKQRLEAFLASLGLGPDYTVSVRHHVTLYSLEPEFELQPAKTAPIRKKTPRSKPPLTSDFWTPSRVAKLKKLWWRGDQTREMVKELGATRGAILGKANRLIEKGELYPRDRLAAVAAYNYEVRRRRKRAA